MSIYQQYKFDCNTTQSEQLKCSIHGICKAYHKLQNIIELQCECQTNYHGKFCDDYFMYVPLKEWQTSTIVMVCILSFLLLVFIAASITCIILVIKHKNPLKRFRRSNNGMINHNGTHNDDSNMKSPLHPTKEGDQAPECV